MIGHQWYWRYEYSDFKDLEFDAYILTSEELKINSYRALEVDNRTKIPFLTQIRILVSASDVIHSWTIPRAGIKVDAVPGRLNQLRFLAERVGVVYGQCSEICGANHRFMPIVLEIIPLISFFKRV